MAGPIEYATKGSACVDLRACFERGCMTVMPGSTALIPSGVKVAIPEGYVGLLFIRSGVSVKRGLRLVNGVGVIDSDYRGEVHIPVTSEAVNGTYLEQGERIAQLGFFPSTSCRCVSWTACPKPNAVTAASALPATPNPSKEDTMSAKRMKCITLSRITGYYRPVCGWSQAAEFKDHRLGS